MDKIISASGLKSNSGERLDKAPGGDVLGHQHAPSKGDALTTQRRLDGETAVAQGWAAATRAIDARGGEPALPVRQAAVVVQDAAFIFYILDLPRLADIATLELSEPDIEALRALRDA